MPPFGGQRKGKDKGKNKNEDKNKNKDEEKREGEGEEKEKGEGGKGALHPPPVHSFSFFFFQAGKKISQDEKHA